MLPGGSKPLLEPILTCHQSHTDAFAWKQFQEKLMNLIRNICSKLHLLLLHCIATCLSNTLLSSVNIHEGKCHLESLIIFCRKTIYISNGILWSTQLHGKRVTHSNQDHTARHKLRNRRSSNYMKISLISLISTYILVCWRSLWHQTFINHDVLSFSFHKLSWFVYIRLGPKATHKPSLRGW